MEKQIRKFPLYRMTLTQAMLEDEEAGFGVNRISLVKSPANEVIAIKLAEEQVSESEMISLEEVEFSIKDNDKRLLVGIALQPEQIIMRKPSKKIPFAHGLIMDEATIQLAADYFLKPNKQKEMNKDHDQTNDGKINAWVTQSWVVEDPKMDKASLYFKDVKKGSWANYVYVEDVKLWDEYVKTGKLNGFSIEGAFSSFLDGIVEVAYCDETIEKKEEEVILDIVKRIIEA